MNIEEFNLNHDVYVKLTDVGRDELKRQHQELVDSIPNYESPYLPPKEDENGFSKFQGWVLMSSLGYLCRAGCQLPFETTIKVDIN